MDNNLVHKSLELGRSDNTLSYNDDLKEYRDSIILEILKHLHLKTFITTGL
tara:strand:+ start:659 stop:811 length:153 start_codon:yes stop_codon:yes gene_type:complete